MSTLLVEQGHISSRAGPRDKSSDIVRLIASCRVINLFVASTQLESPIGLRARHAVWIDEAVARSEVERNDLRVVDDRAHTDLADHQAVVRKTDEDTLELQLSALQYPARRKSDHRHVFTMVIRFGEDPSPRKRSGMKSMH